MSEQPSAERPRVVRGTEAEGRLTPLYPATRLLKASAREAEQALEEARAEAQCVRAEAAALDEKTREKAGAMLAAAESEAERIRAEAREDARAQALAELQGLLRTMDTEVGRLEQGFAKEVQETAFRFARAVLDVEFAVRPERIVPLVEGALRRAAQYRDVRVSVHPSATEFLRQAVGDLEAELSCSIQVTGEEELDPHGVRIDTPMGTFWAGVQDQLRPLREHLSLPPEEDAP